MKNYALIGQRLSHSYSQRYFEELFSRLRLTDHSYTLHEMESLDSLRQWIAVEQINGFNVTNPYKQAVIPLLDELSPEAHAIGAVNCVVVNDGRLIGHNTDAPAFQQTLENILPTIHCIYPRHRRSCKSRSTCSQPVRHSLHLRQPHPGKT